MSSSPTIELIKEKLDIVDVIREYVPTLKKAGRNHKANCPFHHEKTPSFTVSEDKQIYYCFGCNEGGDMFKFVMHIEGLTFHEAARKLALKAGVEYGDERTQVLTEADRERLELKKMLAHAAAFYQKQLFSPAGEKARLYLGERRVSKATVERFGLGWAPPGGSALIDELKARGWSRALAVKAGLVSERDDGRVGDTFRARVVFPIRTQNGETVAFGGRTLDPEGQPKYLNSPETPLFSKRKTLYGIHEALPAVRKTGRLLLLEGYMDVIGCHQHGVDWAVAPLGTALTADHAAIISRYAKDTVVMFDGDKAGIQASVRAAEIFMEAGMYVKLVTLEGGLDPDEFLNDHGREEFERQLAAAKDPLEFRMDLFFKSRGDNPPAQEKAQAIGLLLQTVAKQPDEVLKSEWIKALASRFGVEEASVLKQLRKTGAEFARPEVRRVSVQASPIPALEKGFLQLLLRDAGALAAAGDLGPEDFSHPLAAKLFAAIKEAPATGGAAARALTERFPDEAGMIMELAVSDPSAAEESRQGAAGAARMLKRFSLQRRLKGLKAAGQMDAGQLREYSRLTAELKKSDKEI